MVRYLTIHNRTHVAAEWRCPGLGLNRPDRASAVCRTLRAASLESVSAYGPIYPVGPPLARCWACETAGGGYVTVFIEPESPPAARRAIREWFEQDNQISPVIDFVKVRRWAISEAKER